MNLKSFEINAAKLRKKKDTSKYLKKLKKESSNILELSLTRNGKKPTKSNFPSHLDHLINPLLHFLHSLVLRPSWC